MPLGPQEYARTHALTQLILPKTKVIGKENRTSFCNLCFSLLKFVKKRFSKYFLSNLKSAYFHMTTSELMLFWAFPFLSSCWCAVDSGVISSGITKKVHVIIGNPVLGFSFPLWGYSQIETLIKIKELFNLLMLLIN